MSDLHLFRLNGGQPEEVASSTARLERDIQRLFEDNLRELLGVTFLKSEHTTAAYHKGRIDTLGIDENNVPVIIEYKRDEGDALAQILFYYDWLRNHRADFADLARDELDRRGRQRENSPLDVDWSGTRLLIVAATFDKYERLAVGHVKPTVELVTYRKYGDDLLLIDYVVANRKRPRPSPAESPDQDSEDDTEATVLNKALDESSRKFLDDVRGALSGLGDDITEVATKTYIAFKRLKNFACVVPGRKTLVYLRLDPDEESLQEDFTRDVRSIGHQGTGDLEVSIKNSEDLQKALPLFQKAYETV